MSTTVPGVKTPDDAQYTYAKLQAQYEVLSKALDTDNTAVEQRGKAVEQRSNDLYTGSVKPLPSHDALVSEYEAAHTFFLNFQKIEINHKAQAQAFLGDLDKGIQNLRGLHEADIAPLAYFERADSELYKQMQKTKEITSEHFREMQGWQSALPKLNADLNAKLICYGTTLTWFNSIVANKGVPPSNLSSAATWLYSKVWDPASLVRPVVAPTAATSSSSSSSSSTAAPAAESEKSKVSTTVATAAPAAESEKSKAPTTVATAAASATPPATASSEPTPNAPAAAAPAAPIATATTAAPAAPVATAAPESSGLIRGVLSALTGGRTPKPPTTPPPALEGQQKTDPTAAIVLPGHPKGSSLATVQEEGQELVGASAQA